MRRILAQVIVAPAEDTVNYRNIELFVFVITDSQENFAKLRLVQTMTVETEVLVRFRHQSIRDLCQFVYVKMVIREILVKKVLALRSLVKTLEFVQKAKVPKVFTNVFVLMVIQLRVRYYYIL